MSVVIGFNNNIDAGASLIADRKIIAAVNEERLNRIKIYSGSPVMSINEVLKIGKYDKGDIKYVALSGHKKGIPNAAEYIKKAYFANFKYIPNLTNRFLSIYKERKRSFSEGKRLAKKLFPRAKIIYTPHHLCHASSAFYTSGWKRALIITADEWGDSQSSGAFLGEDDTIKRLHSSSELNSLGLFYSIMTKCLGFKPHHHEGKITGLAAYGKPNHELLKKMSSMIRLDEKRMKFESKISEYNYGDYYSSGFKRLCEQYKREDIASSGQYWLEDLIVRYITKIIDETGETNIALAGGVFANVKANQKIHEIDGVKNIFIHPNMGDGGLSMGSALNVYNKEINKMNLVLKDVYFGPEYDDKAIEEELKRQKLEYYYSEDIEGEVAELLSRGEVVTIFNGRTEYGPRALGNRTIMHQPTDPGVNDWLNKKLSRTEFMPFAPVTLQEYAKKSYKNIEGAEYPAKFMTICFDCTDWMIENCPAVVHVDNTARPQLIEKDANPRYYKIIDQYRKITGIPTTINTSFNMHGEPIVCSPMDAIRSFKDGNLDYLAIGNFIVKNK